jgi:hypothetical protein
MKRIFLFIVVGLVGFAAEKTVSNPISTDALSGKSVYTPPSKSIEVAEEGCVQKDDQNVTGHGAAKW